MPQQLSRRSFLGSIAPAAALAPIVIPSLHFGNGAHAESVDGGLPGSAPDWVEAARRQIPASKEKFFQTAGIAPCPTPVIEHVQQLLNLQNQGPVSPHIYPRIAAAEPDLRRHFARIFGATSDEIALTHSTSEGINIASWAINWKPRDEVIISNQEHPANTIPWYNLSARFGVVVRRVDLSDGTNLLDEMNKTVNAMTRMVSIPHVSRNNGRRLRTDEVAELAETLRSRDMRLHLDGAQGPGCVPVDLHELGCDYYSACGHKWLLAPKGTGAFYCRADMLDRSYMTWTGAHSHASYDQDGNYELLPEARRFEFGTRALANFGGFDAALTWLEDIGLDRVLKRIAELVEHAENAWLEKGHRISSPTTREDRSGICVLELPESTTGRKIYDLLRDTEATYTSPVDNPRDLRIAIHFFNTIEEIDATLDAIERLS